MTPHPIYVWIFMTRSSSKAAPLYHAPFIFYNFIRET